jgi:hypothetical protein
MLNLLMSVSNPSGGAASRLGVPEVKVDYGDKGALPLSYGGREPPTGFEPATTPLEAEVTVVFAPGTRV